MYLLTFKLYTYGSSQVILRVNSLYVSSKFVFQSQSQNRTKEALASVEMVAPHPRSVTCSFGTTSINKTRKPNREKEVEKMKKKKKKKQLETHLSKSLSFSVINTRRLA